MAKNKKNKNKKNKSKKPENCIYIAYAIHPKHQPIIEREKYYCKYCGNEVEPALILDARIGWVHKTDGEWIELRKG